MPLQGNIDACKVLHNESDMDGIRRSELFDFHFNRKITTTASRMDE